MLFLKAKVAPAPTSAAMVRTYRPVMLPVPVLGEEEDELLKDELLEAEAAAVPDVFTDTPKVENWLIVIEAVPPETVHVEEVRLPSWSWIIVATPPL